MATKKKQTRLGRKLQDATGASRIIRGLKRQTPKSPPTPRLKPPKRSTPKKTKPIPAPAGFKRAPKRKRK